MIVILCYQLRLTIKNKEVTRSVKTGIMTDKAQKRTIDEKTDKKELL